MGDTRDPGAAGSTRLLARAPAVIVHGLDAARSAAIQADTGRGLVLLSAPGAGLSAGAGWFAALAQAAAAAVPALPMLAVLDCADAPGAVLAAFRTRLGGAIFTGEAEVAVALAAIGGGCGAVLWRAAPPALDLAGFRPASRDWQERLAAWLRPGAG